MPALIGGINLAVSQCPSASSVPPVSPGPPKAPAYSRFALSSFLGETSRSFTVSPTTLVLSNEQLHSGLGVTGGTQDHRVAARADRRKGRGEGVTVVAAQKVRRRSYRPW